MGHVLGEAVSKPKFEPGMLVYRKTAESHQSPYVVITKRRRRGGKGRREWIYDGYEIRAKEDRIYPVTDISNMSEENLVRVPVGGLSV